MHFGREVSSNFFRYFPMDTQNYAVKGCYFANTKSSLFQVVKVLVFATYVQYILFWSSPMNNPEYFVFGNTHGCFYRFYAKNAARMLVYHGEKFKIRMTKQRTLTIKILQ